MLSGVTGPAHRGLAKTQSAFPRCTKHTLSDARLQAVDLQLCRAEERLDEIRRVRAQNVERQQALACEADGWLAERDVRLERKRRMDTSAARMQSVARGFFVRCFVAPALRAEKDAQELERIREEMQEKMLHMRQNIHDIHFLHLDRERAALRLQAWWRSVLARRLVDLLRIRTKVLEVRRAMDVAATTIQAVQRGILGRQACIAVRTEREREERLAHEEELRMMANSLIKVQSLARRKQARKTVAKRRRERAKEIKAAEHAETEAVRLAASREDGCTSPATRRYRSTRSKTHSDFKTREADDDSPRRGPGRETSWSPTVADLRARAGSDERSVRKVTSEKMAKYRSEPRPASLTSSKEKDSSRWRSGTAGGAIAAK